METFLSHVAVPEVNTLPLPLTLRDASAQLHSQQRISYMNRLMLTPTSKSNTRTQLGSDCLCKDYHPSPHPILPAFSHATV